MKPMKILAIETSCDETAIAIIEGSGNPKKGGVRFSVLSNLVLSQVKLHAKYGGVYPSLAKREHGRNIVPLLKRALRQIKRATIHSNVLKNFGMNDYKKIEKIFEKEPELLKQFLDFIPAVEKPPVDAIAVTYGPGLEPALWVGINLAKALSLVWNIPIIPVNHMEGHIFSALLKKYDAFQVPSFKIQDFQFPALALLISGGHTELVLSKDWLRYKIVGETRDDAVGEAFDKVARMLGLPYPGGPAVSKQAQKRKSQFPISNFQIKLPRPMIDSENFDFSFSGLKTAVLYRLKEHKKLTPRLIVEFSYEFQEAVTEVLTKKTIAAAEKYKVKNILVGGGVSANKRIREALVAESRIKNQKSRILLAPLELTGDNALMIAVAGYIRHALKPETHTLKRIKAAGALRLSNAKN